MTTIQAIVYRYRRRIARVTTPWAFTRDVHGVRSAPRCGFFIFRIWRSGADIRSSKKLQIVTVRISVHKKSTDYDGTDIRMFMDVTERTGADTRSQKKSWIFTERISDMAICADYCGADIRQTDFFTEPIVHSVEQTVQIRCVSPRKTVSMNP